MVALLVLPNSLRSQEHYIGVRGAYGISNMGFNPYQGEKESSSGVDFGIAYKLYAEKFMGTQVELNYVHSGYKLTKIVTTKTDNASTTTTTISNYSSKAVELPIMAQGFLRFGGFRIFVNGGVFGSYVLSQEVEAETIDNAGNLSYTKSSRFSDLDNRLEYGLLGGGGLAFQLKAFELQAEARYQYTLSYAVKPRHEGVTMFTHKNRLVFSVALFYNF